MTGFISLQSRGLSRVYNNTTVQKHQFFGAQPSLWSNSHIWKDHRPLTIQMCVNKMIYLLFNTLSMFITAFKTYSSVSTWRFNLNKGNGSFPLHLYRWEQILDSPEGPGWRRVGALPTRVHTQESGSGHRMHFLQGPGAALSSCSQVWKAFPRVSRRVTAGMSFLPDKPPPGRRV